MWKRHPVACWNCNFELTWQPYPHPGLDPGSPYIRRFLLPQEGRDIVILRSTKKKWLPELPEAIVVTERRVVVYCGSTELAITL